MSIATREDIPGILEALTDLWKRSPAQKMKYIDPKKSTSYVIEAITEGRVRILHGCIVMYDTGSDWCSSQVVLFEQLVLAYEEGYDASKVPEALLGIAKEQGCSAVLSGDTQIGAMSKHYLAAGFSSIGQQFYRSVP